MGNVWANVVVGHKPIALAIKKFNREVESNGLMEELRKREYAMKPSEARRFKKMMARKKHYKRIRQAIEKEEKHGLD